MKKARRRKKGSSASQGVNDIPNIDQMKTDWPDQEDRREDRELDE